MKIVTVLGARPQFIKAATISRILHQKEHVKEIIVHTGQHYDPQMSDVFFRDMQIPKPDYNLGINNMSHGMMVGNMLVELDQILIQEQPDLVLVYGDTNSTLAGALSARKLNIPIAHVEAGLRSFNMEMPEEINRILTDRISDFLFCPSKSGLENLKAEGFEAFKAQVVFSGDVMYDAALFYSSFCLQKANLQPFQDILQEDFVLCTFHRQENTDDVKRLNAIVNALNRISSEVTTVLPLHPRTKKILEQKGLQLNAMVIEPLGYFEMLELLKRCELVMTDSGGLQKEAYFFNKYCITLRDETEWTELVDLGVNTLAGAEEELIIETYREMSSRDTFTSKGIYGDGHAAEHIVNHILGQL